MKRPGLSSTRHVAPPSSVTLVVPQLKVLVAPAADPAVHLVDHPYPFQVGVVIYVDPGPGDPTVCSLQNEGLGKVLEGDEAEPLIDELDLPSPGYPMGMSLGCQQYG